MGFKITPFRAPESQGSLQECFLYKWPFLPGSQPDITRLSVSGGQALEFTACKD
jgi:hypothetical protein